MIPPYLADHMLMVLIACSSTTPHMLMVDPMLKRHGVSPHDSLTHEHTTDTPGAHGGPRRGHVVRACASTRPPLHGGWGYAQCQCLFVEMSRRLGVGGHSEHVCVCGGVPAAVAGSRWQCVGRRRVADRHRRVESGRKTRKRGARRPLRGSRGLGVANSRWEG